MSRDKKMFAKPELIDQFLREANEWGAPLGITCQLGDVDRDYKYQEALFAQGREPLATVNMLRKRAGCAPITDSENLKVTYTRQSLHIVNRDDQLASNDLSQAFDFHLFKDGRYLQGITAQESNWYKTVAFLATKIPGLYSGAYFKHPDIDHVQLVPTRKVTLKP